jgi:hypothetical protein
MRKIAFLFTFIGSFMFFSTNAQRKTENLILITIDGCRWQDVFTGADSSLVHSKPQTGDTAAFIKEYWKKSSLERRQMLMPFFWNTIASKGQIYGNRLLGNNVNVSNHMWFSYPGYNEILCGFADDAHINSNDPIPNPNKNVLEFINADKNFTGKVAAFSSWDAFPFIINEKRSNVPVNSAFEPVTGESLTESQLLMNKLMRKVPEFLGGVRNDAFTFYQGFEYLKRGNPKVLYIALDETDDLAHEGKYGLYLNAIKYTDEMIGELWNWLQTTPQYKDKTTILITVDHGRGAGLQEWRDHGTKIQGSDQTWFAIMGPDTQALGEIQSPGQIYQKQYAATIAHLLGLEFTNEDKAGALITSVMSSLK